MPGVDAFGTQFRRATTLTPGTTFVTMANVTSISGPQRKRDTIEVTSHDSPEQWREFIGGLKDGGEISCDINYDPGEVTHDLDDDFDDDAARNYQIVILPDTADEHTWSIKGVLTELSDEFPFDDKAARTLTIKVTSKPTLAQTGS